MAFRSWSAASRPAFTAIFVFVYFFLIKKKRKTIKAADNFVRQRLHQSLLSPEALLKQYFGRQISYRCYLCSRVCIQVWAYARACVNVLIWGTGPGLWYKKSSLEECMFIGFSERESWGWCVEAAVFYREVGGLLFVWEHVLWRSS